MADQTPDQIIQNFQDLDFTRDIRKQIITAALPEAVGSDKNPEMMDKVLKAADGIDKQALGKLKLNEKAKENQTRENESEALAAYLVSLSNNRTSGGPPKRGASAVAGRELPAQQRPAYDSSIRDQTAGDENTSEFKQRMEQA